ncbi:MAG: DDE-type integrase/transposase/recombinase [Candidatus Bathyarchaeia archaeon]
MTAQSLLMRQAKGHQIAAIEGAVTRIDENTYHVRSQSGNGIYVVTWTNNGWNCTCPDFSYRSVRCKHIHACFLSKTIRREVQLQTIEPILSLVCPTCGTKDKIVRHGKRRTSFGEIQRYFCKTCAKWFVHNLGFERMKASPQAITESMQLYFSGESLRNVQKFLRLQGVNVSHVAIYKWTRKYVNLMEHYLAKITPQVGEVWRADELFLKVKGNMKYLYAVMDDETRFWIAKEVASTKYTADVRPLFAKSKIFAQKSPTFLITDGAQNFHDAFNKELRTSRYNSPRHIQDIRMEGRIHNNKMERMNGEIRDREKVVRGVKREDSPLLTGLQIYHNFVRPHEALNGKTPAEVAGINILGKNKWLTIIQNASQNLCRIENGKVEVEK